MSPQLAFSPADLNLTINHEPRVRDLTIAERLGFADQHKIRTLIQRNRDELEGYGEVSAMVAETADSLVGGRPGREFYLNEGQALLICMFSRTERAAQVRRALIEVFQEHRRQQVAPRLVKVREHVRKIAPRRPALPALAAPEPAAEPAPADDRFVTIEADSGAPAPYQKGDPVVIDLSQRMIHPGEIAAVLDPEVFGGVVIRQLQVDPYELWKRPSARGIVGCVKRRWVSQHEGEARRLVHVVVLGKVVGKED